ncbi:hypothetical protein GCM10009809_34020 [Isoptericola hypogeus]|uniref:Sulfatase N-terminal domain-containing protein n=1 Tax=Isoptericola hypogeus TaxID=300179 RepID=A0ABP4VS00_9MICO
MVTTERRAPAHAAPNVVLVLADDLGIGDLGCYGSPLIRTPHVDALARTGLRAEAMYAAAATDTPSRAGLFTGRHGARYGLPASLGPDSTAGLPADAVTVASSLRAAGYATGLFGQWRLGGAEGSHPLDHGFGRFTGSLYGTDVSPVEWVDGRDAVGELDPATATRRIADDAVSFAQEVGAGDGRGAAGRRPYLAVLSLLAPHAPFAAEEPDRGRSRAGLYGDVVETLDDAVGDLVRRLRRLRRRDERTLVVVTSDNGPAYEGRTQRRRGRKPEVFDGGVRVPFVASWLDGGRGVRDAVPRSLLDVTPTLAALAGAGAPEDLDGQDFSALLTGGRAADRGPVPLFAGPHLNAIRSGRWKLHVAFGADQRQYMPQLYDLEADVRENYNVATLHPDVVDQLTGRLEAVRADVAAEAAARTPGEAA